MREGTKHRYVWLFLLAIAVPSITLAWIGARLIGQEQELEQRRRFDEQRRIVSEVRGVLLRRLEGFRNLSTTMGHSTGLIREQCPVW